MEAARSLRVERAMTAYTRWSVSASDLTNMTPVKARDLIVQCFHQAQREHLAAASEFIHQPHEQPDLRNTVIGAVRLAFKEAGGDYDQPTKAALMKVVQVLARKSELRQTPKEIIAHHKGEIERVLRALD
jgi:hypothetical protein